MTQVLVIKSGALGEADRTALREAGIVAIEADDPGSVRLLQLEVSPLPEIDANDLLFAAISGCQHSTLAQQKFAEYVHDLVKQRRAERARERARVAVTSTMPERDRKGRFLSPYQSTGRSQ